MPVIFIDDLHDARLDPYRGLKQTNLTRDSGLFIAEGIRVVERLIASEFPVVSVLVSERRQATVVPSLPGHIETYIVPQIVAEQLVGYNFHAGVLACGKRGRRRDLIDVLDLSTPRQTIVVCPHITGPENLGTIVRLAHGLGLDAVILGPGSADPFARRVLRVSMGSVLRVPIVESRDLARDLAILRDNRKFEFVAAVADVDAESVERSRRLPRLAILLGNEYNGLEEKWLAFADRRVTIPMQADADSLNVATAAAILMHHYVACC